MKTLALEISHPHQDGRPPDTDWIPDYALTETLAEIKAAGLVGKAVREVPWQEQLVCMASPLVIRFEAATVLPERQRRDKDGVRRFSFESGGG